VGVTEPLILTAMAHPLRRRILDILNLDGPCTASMLSQRTGQAVGNISHHVRILSEARLIEEATELARDRRERWWRRPDRPLTWTSGLGREDAATEAVELAAASLNLERQFGFARRALDLSEEERAVWTEGPFSTETWLRVTPAELSAFAAEINEVVLRWGRRDIPDDGQRRHTAFAFARAVPARP
jgi:DNA-binding transcriptional ArsR family regulator